MAALKKSAGVTATNRSLSDTGAEIDSAYRRQTLIVADSFG
jgi:hypothetical protein